MRGEEYWNTIEHQPTQAIYFFNFSISEILRNESSFSNKIESSQINGVWVQIQTVSVTGIRLDRLRNNSAGHFRDRSRPHILPT